jgi:hypothetical protein
MLWHLPNMRLPGWVQAALAFRPSEIHQPATRTAGQSNMAGMSRRKQEHETRLHPITVNGAPRHQPLAQLATSFRL